ncbi:hypothetical protein [Shewanella xiamenensis]|uniref:hypothetical protein n=1 Tax=Shewanella xiamenensis TaxID=332186 RepID=UPI001558EB55|nr:hypothetical protein [Shewanella xiamenensis]
MSNTDNDGKIVIFDDDSFKARKKQIEALCKTDKSLGKLQEVEAACKAISDMGGNLTKAAVLKRLATNGAPMGRSSIYNDWEDGAENPYKSLCEAWDKYNVIKKANKNLRSGKKASASDNEGSLSAAALIEDKDLAAIPDLTVRHKFSLLFGELVSLRNQLNMAREIKNLPLISATGAPETESRPYEERPMLPNINDYDKEVIQSFLNITSATPFDFDDEGCLVSTQPICRDRTLSMPGLYSILKKLAG